VTSKTSFVPPARPDIADPGLQRPDWTKPGARDPRLLWLDKNENTDPVLAAITTRVLAEIDPRSVAVYPDCAPLYLKLAEHVGVSPHSLLLAPGSDGVIGSTFRAFISPGDRVVLTAPTYQMYPVYARMSGAKTFAVGYERGENGPFLSADALVRTIREARPKLICLPNPDSPTGTVLEPDALKSVIATALDVGAIIQIDEAYHPFYPYTVVPLIEEYPNLIVVRTFSKAWGMTGVRLGYGVASPETTGFLHKVRPNYEVNMVAVEMAVRMLTEFEGEMHASVKRLNEGRDGFLAAMGQLGLRTLVSHGSFAHVAFGDFSDAVHASLADVVLYRKDFGEASLKGFSRFSATTLEAFQPVIERIRRVVRQTR
jgi:histidinol-phosphate aminotransferase